MHSRALNGIVRPEFHVLGGPVYDLILRDATVLSSAGRQVVDVAIKDGLIAYVGPRPPRNRTRLEISAMGKFLMPGVIDTAVQFDPNGDPDLWERESRAAVTGGITTIVALPDGEQPVVDSPTAKHRLQRASGRSWCNFALWGCAGRGRPQDLAAAIEERLIVGTLAPMNEEPQSTQRLIELLALQGVFGVRLTYEDRSGPGINDVVSAARERDKHVHLVHLSTAEELQAIDPVHGQLPVTAGVTPHHLFLSEDTSTSPIRTVPPVRAEMDRRTLWTAMKRGRLDCIASDHHPSSQASAEGVPGAELMFPLMLSAVKYGRLSLEMLVSMCSEAPARIFGLENKGRVARGADADLVLFSEGDLTKVQDDLLLSTAGWSPYLEREAAPKPDLVIVGGRIVARDGHLEADGPTGQHVLA
jgi:dihydroorotase